MSKFQHLPARTRERPHRAQEGQAVFEPMLGAPGRGADARCAKTTPGLLVGLSKAEVFA